MMVSHVVVKLIGGACMSSMVMALCLRLSETIHELFFTPISTVITLLILVLILRIDTRDRFLRALVAIFFLIIIVVILIVILVLVILTELGEAQRPVPIDLVVLRSLALIHRTTTLSSTIGAQQLGVWLHTEA